MWVLYAKSNPDLVKVEGREWTLSIIPALSSAAVATLIAGACWWASEKINRNLARALPAEHPGKE